MALTAVEGVLWDFRNAATRPKRPQTRRGVKEFQQALPEVVMLEVSRTTGVMLRGLLVIPPKRGSKLPLKLAPRTDIRV